MLSRARFLRVAATGGLFLLVAACSGIPGADYFGLGSSPPPPPTAQPAAVGAGQVKVALILPLSAPGNAGATAQSMRNAAEMALAEFNNPDIQLLVKDDGGTAPGAQGAAQQAVAEGAEVILGPLFAQSVGAAGQVARQRGIPVIAFSTDAGVAAPGVYLLSFLPESEVNRVVAYAASQGKRSFAALIPDNAYGTVVQAAFQQAVAAHGG
ncbi:MAG TPA: penicillin-binding protein activator, partial [Pseudolabrys sp.]|nr:penicillin-binding protein activator [Pseudolabrys sp.]